MKRFRNTGIYQLNKVMSTEHVPLANLAMSNDKDAVPETGPLRILQLSTRKIKYRIVMKKASFNRRIFSPAN